MAKIKDIETKLLGGIKLLKNKKYGFLEAGLPRFGRLFGRDSIISAWQLLDIDPEIAKNTIEILSRFQGRRVEPKKDEEPGKILHEHQIGKKRYPAGFFPFPYYGSVDSTPLFLILFSFYYKKTKEKRFLDSHWENILKAINWMKEYGDKDKDYILEYQRKNPKGLFHQGWKDGFENHLKIKPPVAIVEAQGYQYLALIEIGKIAEKIFKDRKLKNSLFKRAEKLKEKLNKRFWMGDVKYFALALDGDKKQRRAITSNPGHLLFCGICQKEKASLVVKKLFQRALWTPYGIRTHSIFEPDFDPKSYHLGSVWPHDNWIIAQGLKKLGFKKEYQKIKNAILKAYKEIGFIPEFYGVSLQGKIIIENLEAKPCYPQAWSSGALLNFLFR